ncbi:hypothetical protein ACFLWX_01275 [Chloroflexota bacterium]
MRVFLFGIGECGNRMVNEFFAAYLRKGVYKARRKYVVPFLIDTDETDLTAKGLIPERHRMLVGRTTSGGHGLGGNRELGCQIATTESITVSERIRSLGADRVEALFLMAGLGGGTGSGMIPVIASKFKEMFLGTPIIAIAALPARSEGDLALFNAAQSLVAMISSMDSILIIDNEKFLKYGTNMHESYRIANDRLARTVRLLAEASEGSQAGVKILDAADVLNTICGSSRMAAMLTEDSIQIETKPVAPRRAELATIGYAYEALPTWPITGKRRSTDPIWRAQRILALTKAASTDCLVDIAPENSKRSLVLVVGPQDEIDAEGFMAAQDWLDKIAPGVEVRAGDYPVKNKMLEILVAFGGISEIPRITEILGKEYGNT